VKSSSVQGGRSSKRRERPARTNKKSRKVLATHRKTAELGGGKTGQTILEKYPTRASKPARVIQTGILLEGGSRVPHAESYKEGWEPQKERGAAAGIKARQVESSVVGSQEARGRGLLRKTRDMRAWTNVRCDKKALRARGSRQGLDLEKRSMKKGEISMHSV